jgi:hypothetical protein
MGMSVSVEHDKAGPEAVGAKPAPTTVVGVPAIPPDRPSDTALTQQLPAQSELDDDAPTGLDIKPVSDSEAERVLADKSPGVAGAVSPKPSGTVSVRTPALASDLFPGLPRPAAGQPVDTETKTRAGVAPQPGISAKGRSTLLLDGTAPPSLPTDLNVDNPPIVVPVSGASPPKAVTQPPPWSESAVKAAPVVPRFEMAAAAPPEAVEELSGSLLLADDSGPEELSASLLIEDGPDGGAVAVTKVPAPTSSAPRPKSIKPPVPHSSTGMRASPSVKPPVPKSMSPRSVPSKPPLSMPALPKTTPAPDVEAIEAAARKHAASVPQPLPQPLPQSLPQPAPEVPAVVSPPFAHAPSAPPPSVTTTQAIQTLVRAPLGQPASPPEPFDPSFIPPPPSDLGLPPADLFPEPPPPQAAPSPVAQGNAAPATTDAAPVPSQAPQGPPPGIPSTAPAAPMTGDIELTRLPRTPVQQALDEVRGAIRQVETWMEAKNLLRPGARPTWFLPTVAGGGLIVGIGLVGLLVTTMRSFSHPDSKGSASASAMAHPSALPTSSVPLLIENDTPPVPSTPPPGPAPALGPCTLTGTAHVIGPSAVVAAGVEVAASGNSIALGFAPDDHEAMAVLVDPTQLTVGATAHVRSHDTVRRVTPILGKGSVSAAIDADRKGDKMQGRRTLKSNPPVQVGATADGQLSWTKLGASAPVPLWAIGGNSPNADAVRGTVDGFGDPTVAIAFRNGASVYMGTIAGTGGLAPVGPLSHVDGLGTSVGSPAVAISNSIIMVAWADRASSEAPWKLRWTRFSAGSTPEPASDFAPPPGGKGEPFMSPSLASAPGGRFLLIWTEGPLSEHVVRALTLGPDGTPLGAPLELSPSGTNAGQAQAAITQGGDGVVAFLESGGKGFQVAAVAITCGKP